MALSVPTETQLLNHMRAQAFDTDLTDGWVLDTLQQATDLMFIATNLSADPIDPTTFRIMQTGILAMGHALLVQEDDKAAIYSPFQTEHVGSYTYTKMVAVVAAGAPTGVPWFDTAVRFLLSQVDPNNSMSGSVGYSSENVFDPGWENYEQLEAMRNLPGFAADIFAPPTPGGSTGNPNDNFGG